jgi:hypothetical protein
MQGATVIGKENMLFWEYNFNFLQNELLEKCKFPKEELKNKKESHFKSW